MAQKNLNLERPSVQMWTILSISLKDLKRESLGKAARNHHAYIRRGPHFLLKISGSLCNIYFELVASSNQYYNFIGP